MVVIDGITPISIYLKISIAIMVICYLRGLQVLVRIYGMGKNQYITTIFGKLKQQKKLIKLLHFICFKVLLRKLEMHHTVLQCCT